MEFKKAVKFVIEDEGGYVNHPSDPGGETKYGIAKRSYPGLDIKNLSISDAEKIYFDDFWTDAGVDRLPEHLKYQFFDMSVNHGAHNATKILQRAAGVDDDGKIGPKTLTAVKGLSNVRLAAERARFFTRIVRNNPSQAVFLEGWINRIFKILSRVAL